MRADIIQRLGLGALEAVRNNPTFPFKTGNLKYNATSVDFSIPNSFSIVFDAVIAPYLTYLEYGKQPQFIFNKHSGKSHYSRGSVKHMGFINERATQDIINYLAKEFRAVTTYQVTNNEGRKYIHG